MALAGTLTRRTAGLIAIEALLIVGAVTLSAWLRLGDDAWTRFALDRGPAKVLVIALACQLCLYYADLYNPRIVADRREFFIRNVQALGACSFLLAAVYFWFPGLVVGRGVFLIAAFLVIGVVVGWRFGFEWFSRRVAPHERLLLVGTTPAAVELARELFDQRYRLGVEIVGFIDPDPERRGTRILNPRVLGTVAEIPAIVRDQRVDRVVVSLADARGKLPMDALLKMKLAGVTFDHLASVYEEYTGKIAVDNLRPSWLIFSSGFQKSRFLPSVKRGVDLTAGIFGLILLSPLLCLIGLLVTLTSPGPILYHQQRVGKDGRIFTIHKFRSMRRDAEAKTGAVWTQPHDDRVTPIGSFLRRTRLDELPQLWNVLIGNMSVVGPRPERAEFVQSLTEEIPFYGLRHGVKPGVTGWAQVRYTYGASVEDALQKLQYDLFYIKNMSVALDLFIIFATIKTVILRRGA